MVGEEPHRIQALLGGTGSDGDVQSLQILLPGDDPIDFLAQHLRLRQLAAAHILTRQHPRGRFNHRKVIAPQGCEIFLSGGIFQHGSIHGRGNELGAAGSQHRGGEHIVRQPVRQLGNHIGSCWRNENHVRLFCQRDVSHVILKIPVKGIHNAPVVAEGFKGQGGDELGGVLGENTVYLCAGFSQGAGNICHFIGGNAAGDAQKDGFSR